MSQNPYSNNYDTEYKVDQNGPRTHRMRPTKMMMTRTGIMLEKKYASIVSPETSVPKTEQPIVVKLGNGQYSHGFFFMVVHATFVAASMSVGAAVRVTMHQLLLYNGPEEDVENTWKYVGATWMISLAMFLFSLTIVYVYEVWTHGYQWMENICKFRFRTQLEPRLHAMNIV